MESSVIAVVGARLSSSRLPSKHLLPLVGKPVIEHIFSRLSHSRHIDKSILATTAEKDDRPLVQWAEKKEILHLAYSGPVHRLVDRVQAVVENHNPEIVVYICGDCPLVDPGVVDAMIDDLRNNQAMVSSLVPKDKQVKSQGQVSIHEGMLVYSRDAWNLMFTLSNSDHYQEHVGSALQAEAIRDKLVVSETAIDSIYFQCQHRISLDTHADYYFLKRIYQLWYAENDTNSIVSVPWVIQKIQGNKALRNINGHVVQRKTGLAPTALMLTQASKTVGLGHVVRSIRIAFALQEFWGAGTRLLILGTPFQHPLLRFVNHQFLEERSHFDNGIKTTIENHPIDCLILDMHPSFTWHDEALLEMVNSKRVGCRVLIDHKTPDIDFDLHWIPCFLNIEGTEKDKETYSGWDSFFLPSTDGLLEGQGQTQEILILSGGSDAYHLGESLPTLLDKHLNIGMHFHWVQGPLAPAPHLAIDSCHQWVVTDNPNDLQELMVRAKFIICVYGVSAIEAIAQGKAVILIDPANRFAQEIQVLVNKGIALFAENLEQVSILLYRLDCDHRLRQSLEQNGRSSFRSGAQHFVKTIQGILEQKERSYAHG